MKKTRFAFLLMALLMAMTFAFPAMAEEEGNAPQYPTVILAGNPTTGYTWNATVEDEAVIAVEDDGFASNAEDENITGAGGFQRFELIGQAEGYTTVTFAYARSWEEGVTPVYELVYDISVDSDLNVTIVSTTFIVGEE